MTVQLPRFVSSLCLSIILISSGVAAALQDCLMHRESVDHAHLAIGGVPNAAEVINHLHKPEARIHCPENLILTFAFGPASSVFRLEPLVEDAAASLNNDTASGGNALFYRKIPRFINPHLSLHLFLSKLRI